MARMLVAYYTRTQHTAHMAEAVAEGAREVDGVEVDLQPVSQLTPAQLLEYDAIAIGSPVYYGSMAAEVKKLLDDSVAHHGKLAGKVGGAFASSGNVGGGNETTVMDILKAWLIHGMVVPGNATGDHYGPVAVGDVDSRSKQQCMNLGRLMARLTVQLHG